MNKQQIFDKAWNHFVVDKAPLSLNRQNSDHEGSACMYRGENGAKCAIGLLIPDDNYRPEMENTTVLTLLNTFTELREILLTEDITVEFLEKLQSAHDRPALFAIKSIEESLREFAEKNKLSIPSV